jgi:C-terminal processing protease CtpA/Prc
MKPLLVACLIGLLPALASAQVPSSTDTDKPTPFEPVLAKDHEGLGRIGIHLAYDKATGLPHIDALVRGGPAVDFGLRVGDIIIKIDKNYTNTLTQDEISIALHGQPGTGVELTVQRGDNPRYIVRAVERRILTADQENMAQPPQDETDKAYEPPVTTPVKP